jgi:hypothetical protein
MFVKKGTVFALLLAVSFIRLGWAQAHFGMFMPSDKVVRILSWTQFCG